MNQPDLPKISVVIACYNYARYVAGAIDSVLDQDYPHKEVVVVNDGSKDQSLEVIQRYASRVVIVNQSNQGHVAACNSGFQASSGSVVIFLDADDLLEPDTLGLVGKAWTPSCAKVQYDLKIINAAGQDQGRRFCHFDARYTADRVKKQFANTMTYRWPVTAGNAYARSFLNEMMPLTVSEAPDGLLNTVAPVFGDVITIPRALGSYRVHGANLWSSTGNDNSRLPKRIQHRRLEISMMQQYAKQRNVALPEVDALDHELPFINYRLMALKLGMNYEGKDRDRAVGLAWRGCHLAVKESLPLSLKLSHVGWFMVLMLMPTRMAVESLIRLRFNRAEVIRAFKRTLGWQAT
jgi:glycosyltransferase involved in cell wall biosynthesis